MKMNAKKKVLRGSYHTKIRLVQMHKPQRECPN
jgi:hypothetical protein